MQKNIELPLHLCQVLEEELENLPNPEHASSPPQAEEDWDFVYAPAAVDEEGSTATQASQHAGDGGQELVTVHDDWGFHAGHVKDAARLRAMLSHAAGDWSATHEGHDGPTDEELRAEPDIYTFLAFSYKGLWDDSHSGGGSPSPDLNTLLNRILRDEDEGGRPNSTDSTVFSADRLERLRRRKDALRSETRSLLDLVTGQGGAAEFAGADDEHAPANETADAQELREERFAKTDLARFRRLLLEDAFPEALRRAYDLRLARIVRRLNAAGRSAICFSGGGIRSGTFALGVIQSLAGRGLLKGFDYLSTVSGGGYIGGWLTAWIHRHPNGLNGVIKDLNGESRASKIEPEPEPLRHLRDYSNFITPRAGLLSADTWTFVGIYIRNLLLNWVVLIPLLASVLMIPRISNAVVLVEPSWRVLAALVVSTGAGVLLLNFSWRTLMGVVLFCAPALLVLGGVWLGGGAWSRWWSRSQETLHVSRVLGAMLAAGTLLGGYVMAYMRLNRPSNSGAIRPGSFWDKHRDQSSFLWLGLLPLGVSATLLTTFWAWFRHTTGVSSDWAVWQVKFAAWPWPIVAGEFTAFLFYGLLLGLTAWLAYMLALTVSWLGARREVARMYRRGAGVRHRYEQARELARHAWKRQLFRAVLKNGLRELVVTVLASIIGAILLYVAAVKIPIFYDPVVSPFGGAVFRDRIVPELLPYERWYGAELYTLLAFPTYLFVFFLGITLFTGLTSRRSEELPEERGSSGRWSWLRWPRWLKYDFIRIEDEDREWLARASAWVFIAAAGWLFVGGLVLFGPLLFIKLGTWLAGIGGASGLVSLLGGGSSRTPGHKKDEAQGGWLKTLGVNMLVVAAFVFCCCIIIAVSLLAGTLVVWVASTFFAEGLPAWVGPRREYFALFRDRYPFESAENIFRGLHFPSWIYLLLLTFGLHAFGRVFARATNLNKFSLHAGYRDRIIRAFLGASRLKDERQENAFTGFDPRDNLYMQELRPQLLRESDFRHPNALGRFVAELNKPADKRHPVAQFLRARISANQGESLRYFKDPPASIEINPSFRTALFGDLNRIIQDEDIPDPGVPPSQPAPTPDDQTGAARIRRNRVRLKAAFNYIKDPPPAYRLMHVVNMTLNLVGGDRLAWQQRRAESFTATPLHSGSLFVGYRRTREYGGKNGISLGTAVAVSGAAASSNMGYFSPSVFVTFVLTFFNARLGWWLGNPGPAGSDSYFRSHPKSALSPILDEAFGLTDDDNPYVLLSDGGHFENLGLYEMIVRRCRNIVVVDGSADPEGSYDDLGGAVRKIRIDFGIPINFADKRFPILSRPESEKESGGYFAIGTIGYKAVDGEGVEDGRLVYIKPAVYYTEPRDIFNYAKGDPSFPHESTADQFFDEPQFESHRMLGYHIVEELFRTGEMTSPPAGAPASVAEFVSLLETKAHEAAEQKAEHK